MKCTIFIQDLFSLQDLDREEPMEETACYGEIIANVNLSIMSSSTIGVGQENMKPRIAQGQENMKPKLAFGQENINSQRGLGQLNANPKKGLGLRQDMAAIGLGQENRKPQGFTEEVTKYFIDGEAMTPGVEETRCIGGILPNVSMSCGGLPSGSGHGRMGAEFDDRTQCLNVSMEETRPLDQILNQTRSHEQDRNTDEEMNDTCEGQNQTQSVKEMLERITKNQVQNIKTTNNTVGMDVTNVGRLLPNDVTVNRKQVETVANQSLSHTVAMETVSMEETKAVGGSQTSWSVRNTPNQTVNHTVAMQETVPIGEILNSTSKRRSMNPAQATFPDEVTTNQTVMMEETKSVGGILSKPESANLHLTLNQPVDVEKTQAVGGILDKTSTWSGNASAGNQMPTSTSPVSNQTVNSSVFMEETNSSAFMEETKPVSKILDKTKIDEITSPGIQMQTKNASASNQTVNFTVPMEETKAVGGILNKPSHKKSATKYAYSNMGSDQTVNITMAMEETKSVGGIIDKTTLGSTSAYENKPFCLNKTVNHTISMEETKAVGGILNRTSFPSTVKPDNVELEKTINYTVAMEETKAVGGICSNLTRNDGLSEVDRMNELAIEETKYLTESLQRSMNMSCSSPDLGADTPDGVNVSFVCGDSGKEVGGGSDEITFRISHKRSLDEMKSEAADPNEGKTQDITQSQTRMLKLKQSLLAMKKVTASQIKAGDIKTPSKHSPVMYNTGSCVKNPLCCSQLDLSTRSPVSKQPRLSVEEEGPVHSRTALQHSFGDTDLDTENMLGSNL